ncbi:4Fe-4S binding protein [Cytobacillus sp. Hz8]|uniref:4Fe-4S binding protein n=1 Tax=Cytobacillus sp. Hz8 TaxID=3347168 RepID=UPI0035DAE155
MIFANGSFLEIEENKCLNLIHHGVECNHCIGNCPNQALHFDNDHVYLEKEKCIGCGLCFNDCPTGVFRSKHWDEITVIKAVEKKEWKITEFFCENHKAPYKQNRDKKRGAIQLPACLSIMSKGGWYELGLYTELELHREECEACPMSETLTRLEYNIGTAAEWLKACGKEPKISFIFKNVNESTKRNLRAIETGLKVTSRRELFISLKDFGRKELINRVDKFVHFSSSSRKSNQMIPGSCLPEWRKRLANIYPKNQSHVSSSAYWPSIKIDNEKCVKCEMCSKFCPAGALRTVIQDGTISHYFSSGLCLDCRTCQLFCPRQAITRGREQLDNPFETQTIATKRVGECQICGNPTSDSLKHFCYMCETEAVNENQLAESFKKIFLSI